MAYSGKYTIKNPAKYNGDPKNIRYDSLWERQICVDLDNSNEVLSWSREPFAIPYYSPVDHQIHKYFVDFWVKKKNSKNKEQEIFLIEVKPFAQCVEPKPKTTKRGKPTKQFISEAITWSINSSKWKALANFCEEKGWKFVILNEKNYNFPKG